MAKVVLKFLGSHIVSKEYYENDCILYGGDTWRAKQTTSTTPSAGDNWELYYEGGYRWVNPGVNDVDVLVVAGGGGSGQRHGDGNLAGAGAGSGVINRPSLSVSGENTFSIYVGDGGDATGVVNTPGYPGEDSNFGSLVAIGGGGGAPYDDSEISTYPWENDGDGGSGGGGGGEKPGGSGIQPLQSGDSGEYGHGNDGHTDGGGGGAGGAGSGGNGGPGLEVSGTFYGAGGDRDAALNASGNTGDGGTGGSLYEKGGDGGSGIVIVSYIPPQIKAASDTANFVIAESYGLDIEKYLSATDAANFTLAETSRIAHVLKYISASDAANFTITESYTKAAQQFRNAAWVFEVAAHKWSTQALEYSGDAYTAKVIPGTFSGVSMRYDPSGALIAPNDLDFEVIKDGGLLPGDLEGEYCTIRLIFNDVAVKNWVFKINRAVEYYGKIKCYCVDFLHNYLTGDYPNTPSPHEIWSSNDDSEDDYCIPVVLDSAYIPVRSVNTGLERFYVLGEQGPTYTVHEVRSPHSWPSVSTWDAASYDMIGSTDQGWQLLQPIIADSTGNGSADAPGLWRSGNRFYDMLCYYERSDTAAITSPIAWIKYVLEDFGVPTAYIGDTFAALEAAIDQTLYFTGGFFRKQGRERLLVNMLSQVDCYIVCDEKVEIYQFAKTSQATFPKVITETFRPQRITRHANNAGRVHWPEGYDKPMDVLNGKGVVPIAGGGDTDKPSSEILKCWFMAGQSINAQKAGILHFQKKYGQKNRMSFSVDLTSFEDMTIHPGQVITISNPLYGGTHTLILTDLRINRDLRADITAIELYALEEWADLTTTTKDVVTDDSDGFSIADTDYSGELDTDADWNNLLNIPDRFKETASLGVNVTDSYLGYYDGTVFKSYIGADATFQFRGDANNYINYDGTALNIVGLINAWNKSGDLTKIDGGAISTNTITATQIAATTITAAQISSNTITADRMNVTTLSSIAANIGTVTAGKIESSNWGASDGVQLDLDNSTFKVRSADGLKIEADGGLAFSAASRMKFYTNDSVTSKYIHMLASDRTDHGFFSLYPIGYDQTSVSPDDTSLTLGASGDNKWRTIKGVCDIFSFTIKNHVYFQKVGGGDDIDLYVDGAVTAHDFITASRVPDITDKSRALDHLLRAGDWLTTDKKGNKRINYKAHYSYSQTTRENPDTGDIEQVEGLSTNMRLSEMEKMIYELNQEIEALKNGSKD